MTSCETIRITIELHNGILFFHGAESPISGSGNLLRHEIDCNLGFMQIHIMQTKRPLVLDKPVQY